MPFVSWEYRASALAVIDELKRQAVQIVALERTTRSVRYTQVDYRIPTCVVVGHERAGLDNAILDAADVVAEIPMWGEGRSLNVATALGIGLYEILRRIDVPQPPT